MKSPRQPLVSTPEMRAAVTTKDLPTQAQKPKSQLTRDTRVGDVYWCDFSPLNWPPEFDYQHLVVIVRGGKIERDIHIVLPLTKADRSDNPHGYRLAHNPNPGSADRSWAVCNHVYAVASERLKPLRDAKGNRLTPRRLADEDIREISSRLRRALGTFLSFGLAPPGEKQS